MVEMGNSLLLYSRATDINSSWLRYRFLHCQKPVANSGISGGCPVASANWPWICLKEFSAPASPVVTQKSRIGVDIEVHSMLVSVLLKLPKDALFHRNP